MVVWICGTAGFVEMLEVLVDEIDESVHETRTGF